MKKTSAVMGFMLLAMLGFLGTSHAEDMKGEKACSQNSDCASTEFCAKAVGDCEGRGSCRERPASCVSTYPVPVCGCDGQDYSDGCEAARQGVNVARRGHCK